MNLIRTPVPQNASTKPSAPPMNASSKVSVSTWRTIRARLEPRASRVENSCSRAAAFASKKFARFAQAISKTIATIPINTFKGTLEDKILQRAVVEVLNSVYEEDFLGFSYGFRPGRGPHDALDALAVGISGKKVNWILDADVSDFFSRLDHSWMERFLEHRIADKRVLRLIRKWMTAGVIEDGNWSETVEGSPQGASVSPLLANVYLHYVFDLWADWWRRRYAHGEVIIVRFADDFVVGFQHLGDAKRFLSDLRKRFAKFSLELHPDKTIFNSIFYV